MGLFTIILIVGLIILAVVAIKFLVGAARTIISLALFLLAAILLINFLTGQDLFGVTAMITSLLP